LRHYAILLYQESVELQPAAGQSPALCEVFKQLAEHVREFQGNEEQSRALNQLLLMTLEPAKDPGEGEDILASDESFVVVMDKPPQSITVTSQTILYNADRLHFFLGQLGVSFDDSK
jgi:hypothetical protein